MQRKEAVYKGLEFIPVLYEDPSLTSPDYFQISEFPTKLTAGKNLFKLRGHPTNLTTGGVLGIEVLDYNGDPIYEEYVPKYSSLCNSLSIGFISSCALNNSPLGICSCEVK